MTAHASAPAGGPGRVLRQLADAAFQVARAERQARSQPTACHRAHDAPAAVDTATEPSLNGRDRLLAGRAVANPETWRVGDRARVKVGSGVACSELRHHPEEQGHAGRVIGHRTLTGARSHSFLVAFDRPVPVVGMGAIGPVSLPVRYYAADELEPVE